MPLLLGYAVHPPSYPFHLTCLVNWVPGSQEGQGNIALTAGDLKHSLISHGGKTMMLHANLGSTATSVYLPVINPV